MRQEVEYGLAAILVAYIAFATRPAPAAITSVLAQPIAQLVALGLVVYIGARLSLLVALLLGLAFVLSTPTREYADDPSIKKAEKKTDAKKTEKKTDAKKTDDKKADVKKEDKAVAKPIAKPTPKPATEEPTAAGQKVGKETFVSSLAATAADF